MLRDGEKYEYYLLICQDQKGCGRICCSVLDEDFEHSDNYCSCGKKMSRKRVSKEVFDAHKKKE